MKGKMRHYRVFLLVVRLEYSELFRAELECFGSKTSRIFVVGFVFFWIKIRSGLPLGLVSFELATSEEEQGELYEISLALANF